jgi:hypothetical protein
MKTYSGERASENPSAATGGKIVVSGRFIKTAALQEQWYEDVRDPELLLDELKKQGIHADLLTFWQRFPDTEPRYGYTMKHESLAVLKVDSFDDWCKGLSEDTRRNVRKAEKKGVVIRECKFDDDFVRGMMDIFNESPMKQGRPFRHYGKDFDTVKAEFSRYLFREVIIGAYYENKLIGFIMLSLTPNYALPSMIISKLEHRDKAPTNALLGAAIKVCEQRKIPYLVYNNWSAGSLGEFKRRNNFIRVEVPRYFIPLTLKGRVALLLGLHYEIAEVLPEQLVQRLITLRNSLNNKRYGNPGGIKG